MEESQLPEANGGKRARRWARRKEARPGEILDAALACFSARGFAATRLDEVALRAGVTKGTVYLYFPNKEELFKAVVREALLPKFDRVFGEFAEGPDDPAEQIRKALTIFVEELLPSPLRVIPKLIVSEAQNFPDLARFYLDEVVGRARAFLAGAIRRGIERGQFREVDPDHVFYVLVAPMLLAALWQQSLGPYDDRPFEAPAMIRTHLDILFRGLSPASPGGPSGEPAPAGADTRARAGRTGPH